MKMLWTWLLVAALAWLALWSFVPRSGQGLVFYGTASDRFCDFWYPRECAASACAYRPETVPRMDACYPPLGYALAGLFPRDKNFGGPLFAALAAVLLMASVGLCARGGVRNRLGWAVAALFVQQMLDSLGVANQVIVAAAGVCVFFAWKDEKGWRRLWALLALSFAVALKVAPCLFALVLLRDRRWRDFALVAVVSFLLVAVPFAWFGGLAGISDFMVNLRLHAREYTVMDGWGFIAIGRAVALAIGFVLDDFRRICLPFRALNVLLALVAAVAFFRKTPAKDRPERDALLLALVVTLLPGSQHVYTGLYFLPAALALPYGRLRIEHFLFFALFCPLQLPVGGFTANHLIAASSALALGGLAVRS